MRRLRNLTLSVVLAAAALALTALALEVVLRATHLAGARLAYTQPDDRIGWRFTPGREYWHFKENDHPISGRINSMGWRDVERTRAKPAGVLRVAVVGDSFVEALQVELDSTFCRIAERELTATLGRPVEVMNFGRSGTTTTEQLLVLESDVLPCSPDLVALFFVPDNDIADVAPKTALDPMRPFFHERADSGLVLDTSFNRTRSYRIRRLINPLKQHSALVSLAATRYNLMRQSRRIGNTGESRGGMPAWLSLCTDSPDSTYAANFALNQHLLTEVAKRCARDGVPFLLICGPAVYRTGSIERLRRIDPSFDPDDIEASLRAWAEGQGAGSIGLQSIFRERYASDGGSLTWSHLNYMGHRVVAGSLGDWMEKLLLH